MKYIVTGASGFVGSNLVKELLKHEETEKILCLDLERNWERLPENSKVEFLSLSIEHISKLEEKICSNFYDVFYHFAWVGSAGPLRMDERVQTQNALWTVDCLRTAAKIGVKKFVVAGSIMEFESNFVVSAQGTRPSTYTIYGSAKAYAHYLCKPIACELGVDLVWAYITNTYGIGEKSPRFINQTLRKIIHHEPLEFTSGVQNYDFIYISDLVTAFYLLGLKGVANCNYIIGSGDAKPLKEFIIEMTKANGPDIPLLFGNLPFTGVSLPLEIYSISQLENDTGFKPKVSFVDGTRLTLNWLKEIDDND